MTQLRDDLTRPIPIRIVGLPIARGYPVPWFVAWQNAGGNYVPAGTPGAVPEFRVMDQHKFIVAIKKRLCWICGETLGKWLTFVAGPMCGVNRTSGEPPCHTECAEWAVRNCPFLSKPQMVRREGNMPEGSTISPFALLRNPGITLLWTTRNYEVFDGAGKALLEIGEPHDVSWWREGRPATRAEVRESVMSGMPFLDGLCDQESTDEGISEARAELGRRLAALEMLYPAEAA